MLGQVLSVCKNQIPSCTLPIYTNIVSPRYTNILHTHTESLYKLVATSMMCILRHGGVVLDLEVMNENRRHNFFH